MWLTVEGYITNAGLFIFRDGESGQESLAGYALILRNNSPAPLMIQCGYSDYREISGYLSGDEKIRMYLSKHSQSPFYSIRRWEKAEKTKGDE